MGEFFASVGRFVKALFKSNEKAGSTPEVSDELELERELRRGMRGD